MNKPHHIEQLRSRSEKVYANGRLLDYKLYGDRKRRYYQPQVYEKNPYNPVQNFLYKRALFGLSIYNKQEIREMTPKEKSKIVRLHHRTQRELNIWKQQLIIESSNQFLKLFPNSPLAQEMIKDNNTDPKLRNKFNFNDLGIKKQDVVERLHKAGILPDNFYEINAR